MKIAYLSSSRIPSTIANSVHVMHMCNGLAKTGNDVVLVATNNGGEERDPFAYYAVPETFKLVLVKSRIGKLKSIRRLIVEFRIAAKNDLIYTRWSVIAFFVLLFQKKPVIMEYHQFPYSFWQKLLEKYVLRHKRTVQHVFISERLKTDYIHRYPFLEKKHCIVLPVGAEPVNAIEPAHNRRVLSCGYIGSFKKGKGAELVFSLAGKMPHTPFHIVGGSDTEIKLMKQKYFSENIVWHGALAYKDAMKILSDDVDIALLPNQKEVLLYANDPKSDIGQWTSPMKLLEYLSYGKAVVASDLPILKEILIDDENCLLADPDDLDAWCSAVSRLAENAELCERLGRNGRILIIEELSWERRAEKSLKFLN